MPIHVITTPLSLGRLLWWYGEDSLWEKALVLSPDAVAAIGERAAQLLLDESTADALWPERPRGDWALLLAGIEALSGVRRPAARRRRRPAKSMPSQLVATEADLWFNHDLKRVEDAYKRRSIKEPGTGK